MKSVRELLRVPARPVRWASSLLVFSFLGGMMLAGCQEGTGPGSCRSELIAANCEAAGGTYIDGVCQC